MNTPIPNQIIREITPLSDKDCFYIAERYKTEFTYPIHNHSEFELNFTEKAAGVRRVVGDSSEVIGDYDLVLITGKDLDGNKMNVVPKRYERSLFNSLQTCSLRALSIKTSSTLFAGCWIRLRKDSVFRCLLYSRSIPCWIRLLLKSKDSMQLSNL